MAEPLRPDGDTFVEDVVIRTPGLIGEVEVYRPASPGMRGEELTTEEFHQALADAGLDEQLSVVISQHQEITPAAGTRGSGGADDIEVNVPEPGDGNGQVLLYAAEDGSLSWHLAEDVRPTEAPDRGGERRTYRIPRAVVPPEEQEQDAHRGIVGAIGKKVLKVLVFPLVDPVLGKVGDHFVTRWEDKQPAEPRALDACRRLPQGRGAVVHRRRLDDLPRRPRPAARARHLLHGPRRLRRHPAGDDGGAAREVRRPGRRLRPPQHLGHAEGERRPPRRSGARGGTVEIDVVTHSRGGLVGREIASAGDLDVRGLVMVAAPNAGTVLADRKHLSDLLDRVTDLAQFVPDNGVTDTLGIVFAVVKQLAVGAVGGLDGLMAMNPAEGYLAELNGRPASAAQVRAIAADYEPPQGAPSPG